MGELRLRTEAQKEKRKQYDIDNRDKVLAWRKAYYYRNKEKILVSRVLHYPQKNAGRTARRHLLGISNRYNDGVSYTRKTIQRVYEDNIKQYGTLTCYYCLKPIDFGKDTLEHKQPISRGGTNQYNNLAIACISCNSSKGNKTVNEFIEWKGIS